MTRCWNREKYKITTGKEAEYNDCGDSYKGSDGIDYCMCDGIFKDYGNMRCANSIKPKELEEEQLSFY